MPACAGCARDGAGSLCGGCRSLAYCDAGCQRAHWAAHKPACRAIRADMARGEGWAATACDACGATLVGVGQRCSGCYAVEYCDAACQLAHWKRGHKAVCKAVGEAQFARHMAAATAGDDVMMHNVGVAYENGTGVAVDKRAAFEWYRRAAEAGVPSSQFNLATILVYGSTGSETDLCAAFKWFRRAAEAGHSGAQNSLGACYEMGVGCDKNPRAAFEWIRRAASAGSMAAMANVGACYVNGVGVARDLRAARRWFERAVAAGDARAKEMLAELDTDEAQ